LSSTLGLVLTDTTTTSAAAVVVAEYLRRVSKRHERRMERIARDAASQLVTALAAALDQRIERIERIIDRGGRHGPGRWP
jgi:Flp pilus assembly protein TadB